MLSNFCKVLLTSVRAAILHELYVTLRQKIPGVALACVIVIVDGHCGRVVVTQHGFGVGTGIQRRGANFRISNHSWVTKMDVEILILLKDIVINHSDCDLW